MNLDGFTCATGTGGTFAGVTRVLKERSNGRVKCFLADPPGSVLYGHVKSGRTKLGDRIGGSITEGIGQGRVTTNLEQDIHLVDECVWLLPHLCLLRSTISLTCHTTFSPTKAPCISPMQPQSRWSTGCSTKKVSTSAPPRP